jgi:hypothetical protein
MSASTVNLPSVANSIAFQGVRKTVAAMSREKRREESDLAKSVIWVAQAVSEIARCEATR